MINPKITIGLPVHNHGEFVGESIQSILNNNYNDFELIVSNNASTDDTDEVINSFRDPRIRYLKHEMLMQAEKHFDTILDHARGNYFALYHSDDVYLPEIIGEEVKALDYFVNTKDSTVVAVVTSGYSFDDRSKKILARGKYYGNSYYYMFDYKKYLYKCFQGINPFPYPTACYKTDVLRRFGYSFSSKYMGSADVVQWLGIMKHNFKVAYINRRLFYYRYHDQWNRYASIVENPLLSAMKEEVSYLVKQDDISIPRKYFKRHRRNVFKDMIRRHIKPWLGTSKNDVSLYQIAKNIYQDKEIVSYSIKLKHVYILFYLTTILILDCYLKPGVKKTLSYFKRKYNICIVNNQRKL